MISFQQVQPQIDDALRDTPADRRDAIRQLVLNQFAYFEYMAKEEMTTTQTPGASWGHDGARSWSDTIKAWGKDWPLRFIGTLIKVMERSKLWDLVDFGVAAHVVEPVVFKSYELVEETGEPPYEALRFKGVDLQMQTRRGPRIEWGQDISCDWFGQQREFLGNELWPVWINTVDTDITRHALADMVAAGRNHGYVPTSMRDLVYTIERESVAMHRLTCAGPANKVVLSPEVAIQLPVERQDDPNHYGIQFFGRLKDRWDIYVDPQFPKHETLLFHHTGEPGHCGMLVRLYQLKLFGHMGGAKLRMGKLLGSDNYFTLLRIQEEL